MICAFRSATSEELDNSWRVTAADAIEHGRTAYSVVPYREDRPTTTSVLVVASKDLIADRGDVICLDQDRAYRARTADGSLLICKPDELAPAIHWLSALRLLRHLSEKRTDPTLA